MTNTPGTPTTSAGHITPAALSGHPGAGRDPRRSPLPLAIITALLLAPATLSLSACGFQPLYGDQTTTTAAVDDTLSMISIANIPNREGQLLRNELMDRFYKQGRPSNPRYDLRIESLDIVKRDLDITKTSDATRGQMRVRTMMQLVDPATGQAVMTRRLSATTSYNILSSRFTTRVSEDNARELAIRELANQIETQLALYLKSHP